MSHVASSLLHKFRDLPDLHLSSHIISSWWVWCCVLITHKVHSVNAKTWLHRTVPLYIVLFGLTVIPVWQWRYQEAILDVLSSPVNSAESVSSPTIINTIHYSIRRQMNHTFIDVFRQCNAPICFFTIKVTDIFNSIQPDGDCVQTTRLTIFFTTIYKNFKFFNKMSISMNNIP